MTSSRSKKNKSPSLEDSIGMPIQITDQRRPSQFYDDDMLQIDENDQMQSFGQNQAQQQAAQLLQQHVNIQSQQNSNCGQYQRDEVDLTAQSAAVSMRSQVHRQSQPDKMKGTGGNIQSSYKLQKASMPSPSNNHQDGGSSKQMSPKQNTRQFIIRNTTQNFSVPTQQGVHQPKVVQAMNRPTQPIAKKGKTPIVNGPASQSFQLNSRPNNGIPSKKASPMDGYRDGNMRRLSQNQNSINTYLEQESKFDSTKDASDQGAGGPGAKDYASSLPDSVLVKGSGGNGVQNEQRSYDEAWQVDHGSQNSYQHGEASCEPHRLDSAQTSILNKRRPSAQRQQNDFFEAVGDGEQVPGAKSKSKKQMQHLSQPRTKEYARKAQYMRGTLQSQNQNRFADQMIDDEYAQMIPLNIENSNNQLNGTAFAGGHKNHYNSPVQLREMGLSQQMVPNSMKQQLKQRRTVYGQSFFNSPPYPSSSQHFGGLQHQTDTVADSQYNNSSNAQAQPSVEQKTRNAQLDSSLRRKRQLPVPSSSNLPQPVTKNQPKPVHHRLMSGNNNHLQQSQHPPQSQQRRTLQKHIDSAAQHIEFDERQQNEGRISQLSQFNAQYHVGMRNVLTAGENNPRHVDHFPVSRASRWKHQNAPNHHKHNAQVSGNVYDHLMNMEARGSSGNHHNETDAGSGMMPGIGRHYNQMPLINQNGGSGVLQRTPHVNEAQKFGLEPVKGSGALHGNQQFQHNNTKHLPKRSGTASYITQGGVRITINKDNKHLNGDNLKPQTEENMNLMFYDFNNNAGANSVIPEENPRNVLRSQTTDRGPSRKLRSRGRFKLASSNALKRQEDEAGLGDVRPPFGVSTDFEMGMYPPQDSTYQDELAQDSINNETIHSSLMHQQHQQSDDQNLCQSDAAVVYQNNSKNSQRNIQGKRLSSHTIVQQRQSQHGHRGSAVISSHQQQQQQQPQDLSDSPVHAQSAGARRIQKQYRPADGVSANKGAMMINSNKMSGGPRQQPKTHNEDSSSQMGLSHPSRLPQHRQTNLANVMECIREEDPQPL